MVLVRSSRWAPIGLLSETNKPPVLTPGHAAAHPWTHAPRCGIPSNSAPSPRPPPRPSPACPPAALFRAAASSSAPPSRGGECRLTGTFAAPASGRRPPGPIESAGLKQAPPATQPKTGVGRIAWIVFLKGHPRRRADQDRCLLNRDHPEPHLRVSRVVRMQTTHQVGGGVHPSGRINEERRHPVGF